MRIHSSVLMLSIYTIFFFAVPIHHMMTGRDMQPALKISVDVLSIFVGLFSFFVITTVLSLHRRIASLEKAASSTAARSDKS